MSQKGSVFQKGGGGTNFEQLVQTAFLTTLIIHGNAPCLDSGELSEVALQVTNRGYETDDFMVTAKSASGEHRILIQVKHDMRPLQNLTHSLSFLFLSTIGSPAVYIFDF